MGYPFKEIEKKWQHHWEREKTFRTPDVLDTDRPKFYVLDMFPYPSGKGLHVGHPEGYTATDIFARYKRMRGYNVLHPMGWDAFGLPAEQYAIESGTHPRITTENNISKFRDQLKAIGFSYDWDRQVDTTDPAYYRWTQWIFLQLWKKGLAYIAEVPVNWCPALGTVLANEEVIDGKSERGGHPVFRRPMRQWMLKITEYAEQLLNDLDEVDWPESTKEMQRNWIGRSEGAEIDFELEGIDDAVMRVFTTRPDTLFGATYMVLSPEHPLVERATSDSQRSAVLRYCDTASRKSDLERTELQKEKTGVFTGGYAINTATGEPIPVWIADYVLISYGTGAIMAVPAHDERDYEFARKYDLPIREVISGGDVSREAYVSWEGTLVNSASDRLSINGMAVTEAVEAVISWLESTGRGSRTVNYKLRDWLFSRQRYWGEPIPIIHAPSGEMHALEESELPLTLPEMEDFRPRPSDDSAEQPMPPLSRAPESWRFVEKDGIVYSRELNTMPQWAGSCWYYLRYIDPDNDERLVDPEKERYWMPVDLYIGGAEHSVLHLLYARFWHKVLYDIGVVSTREPFAKLVHQGMILGETEYTLFLDAHGKPVSAAGVSADGVHEASGEQLTSRPLEEAQVVKKGDAFVWEEDHSVVVDARSYKMSKSRGNIINPDDIITRYGADSLRLYEMFMGPLVQMKPWSMNGVEGVNRFLNRVWRLVVEEGGDAVLDTVVDDRPDAEQLFHLHTAIEKVTSDIESLQFNTAISAMMIFVNEATRWTSRPRSILNNFLKLLSPFAPHLSNELWSKLGNQASLESTDWPSFNPAHIRRSITEVVIQVNGKLRHKIEAEMDLSREALQALAMAEDRVQNLLDGKEVLRIIVVPNKLVNFVVK